MIEICEGGTLAKLGNLSDCITCVVTECLNSSYELVLTYPINGENRNHIMQNRVIRCKPNPYDDAECFRIYKISKPMGGVISVYAEHISYAMTSYICFPDSTYKDDAGAATTLLMHIYLSVADNVTGTGYYSMVFNTDIERSEKWEIADHMTVKEAMAYAVSLFGGEWKFNGGICTLMQSRGQNRGCRLEYANNVIDATQTNDNSSIYTHIMPYCKWNDSYLYGSPKYVPISMDSDSTKYFRPYLLDVSNSEDVIDWINRGEEPPAANISIAATHWSILNGDVVGNEDTNITVQIIQRGKTAEYSYLTDADHIELGDIVSVDIQKYGISLTKKVVKTVYDAVRDMLTSVELGTLKRGIQDMTVKIKESEDKDNADSDNKDESSSEIPEQVTKVSDNEVYFLFKETKVTWTASGSGDTRKNFKKTVEKRTDNDSTADKDEGV